MVNTRVDNLSNSNCSQIMPNIRNLESVHWIMDLDLDPDTDLADPDPAPVSDPALFFSGFQYTNKKRFYSLSLFVYFLL